MKFKHCSLNAIVIIFRTTVLTTLVLSMMARSQRPLHFCFAEMTASPFEELDLEVCVSLLPSDIGDIYAGIRRHLYRYLMKYHDSVGGVLLAFSSLSFANGAREGRIGDEMPHIHFDVKGKAQVFRPRAGHVLEGRVNKVEADVTFQRHSGSKFARREAREDFHERLKLYSVQQMAKVTSTHVGMLVCGIFNASVAAEEMGEGFAYDMAGMAWRRPRGEAIALGDDTQFVVKRMHEAAGLISIEGSFEGLQATRQGESTPASPSISPIANTARNNSSSKPPKKKKAKRASTGKNATVKAEL